MAGVTQRSSRSMLTIVGTALGIGSFIAVLGVTSSANGQISREFDEVAATQISVQLASGTGALIESSIPKDAEQSIADLNGVDAVGSWWDVSVNSVSSLPPNIDETGVQVRVLAASPGYWDVVRPKLASGRVYDDALALQPVAVVGEAVAKSLNLTNLEQSPTVFVNGEAFTVIGIVRDASRGSAPLSAITIPADYAREAFENPGSSETVLVETDVGASALVASQIALTIDPRHPEWFKVSPPPTPTVVRDAVNASVQTLFLALALICLLVGAVGITNASLIGVIARVPEIGLRRSLGALPRHIAAQFLLEAAIRGLIGGAIGSCVGLVTVVGVAIAQNWTAVIQPWTIVGAPLVGAFVGLLAGLYPAIRASRIEPVEAFRR